MRVSQSIRAFTLIELLTVIAIIGLLSAIIIPTVGSARVSAKRAKTKVVFSQWATAMEQFRQEYGYYPQIDNGTGKIVLARFAGALTGKAVDGTAATTTDLCGNTRRISFYTLSDSDLNATRTALVDPFGNEDIAVYYDRNADGRITSADGHGILSVAGNSGTLTPTAEDMDLSATVGIHATVIFYSAGRGDSGTDLVFSWK